MRRSNLAAAAPCPPSLPVGSRILSGPEAVKAASKLRAKQSDKEKWPYEWYFPPDNALPRQPKGTISAPSNGVATPVLVFEVPTGFDFIMWGLVQQFTGTGLIPGSTSAVWDLLLNPSTYTGGLPIADLAGVPFTLGDFNHFWRFAAPQKFVSLDVIQSQVTTSSAITPGGDNYFSSILVGWFLPSAK